MQQIAASGEHLVRIGLVAHVPNQPVIGGIENIMQRDGELDRAQTGSKMTPASADALDQELAQLLGQLPQLGGRQRRRSAGRWMESSKG